ncbi:hypothetical protein PCL_10545 [Purpureocillium lilacinum]|uniref:Uncharacterized protein n=1 Tax=Purpureocillium lilacinum TaxID=33203 RepID=A0A2U3DQ31_PURLI|nr:hypothetical protein PCL_10545 [Purpureocillium lilacinum]
MYDGVHMKKLDQPAPMASYVRLRALHGGLRPGLNVDGPGGPCGHRHFAMICAAELAPHVVRYSAAASAGGQSPGWRYLQRQWYRKQKSAFRLMWAKDESTPKVVILSTTALSARSVGGCRNSTLWRQNVNFSDPMPIYTPRNSSPQPKPALIFPFLEAMVKDTSSLRTRFVRFLMSSDDVQKEVMQGHN